MDCDTAREALSARIDGEREPVPSTRVDEHLADCGPCRDWQAAAVEQTQLLRKIAGRSQLAAVRQPADERSRWRAHPAISWQRCALGAVGLVQLGVAGHVLNESTAWSAALGVVMLAAAVRPVMAGGLTWVLATFSAFLFLYEVIDTDEGRVTIDRPLTHLPVVVGAVLALLVWRRDSAGGGDQPDRTAAVVSEDIVLPENASRGRRRGHLRSADGSAA